MSYLLLEDGSKIYIEDLTGFIELDEGFTRPGKVVIVSAESRIFGVSGEDRISLIEGETRLLGISQEDRRGHIVPIEPRFPGVPIRS